MTGMFRSGAASRKCASIAAAPDRNSSNRSGPIAIISDSPIGPQTE